MCKDRASTRNKKVHGGAVERLFQANGILPAQYIDFPRTSPLANREKGSKKVR